MFIRVLDCVTTNHNPVLVLLAVAVAFVSGFTLFSIVDHIRAREGRAKELWTLVAAFVAGAGIWSTHFIAMLGFHPAAAVSYNAGLTAMSALLAIGFAAIAIPLLVSAERLAACGGSLVLGAAIGVMHFTGMRALTFAGQIEWDGLLVVISLGAGSGLVVAATLLERRRPLLRYRFAAGAVFGLAICSLHFIAMSAALLRTSPALSVATGNLSEFYLGLCVALTTALIVVFSLVTVMFDRRAHNAAAAVRQMRSILQSTQTGILVCQDDKVVSANCAFERLVGVGVSEIEGRAIGDFIELAAADAGRTLHPLLTETRVKTAGGTLVDVAIETTPVTSGGPHRYLLEVRDIRDQKQARELMIHLANHDALTGLPNRRVLDAALQEEARSNREFSLLWMDLDHFKEINDTHGHAVGDAVLREVAQRFREVLDDGHLCARVGGDEFVALFRHSAGQGDPVVTAKTLLEIMVSPVLAEDRVLTVGLSIGVASYPRDAQSAEALMRRADFALYEAKKTGRSCYARAA
jgi:diguanylate cyclase (GGDEF)-like protein/PAS domain S-box-containing protein